ncbi:MULTISPECIES: DUF4230 domain-containing protein [unclassified Acinetobacter]|uniref:DUF4230 domain-containing protein n=1 Tax=unclassified Acinetobacter TaxID=196816 RepID=UPI0035BB6E31
MTTNPQPNSHKKGNFFSKAVLSLFVLSIVAVASAFFAMQWYKDKQPKIDVLTSAGVLQRIQHLSNLETVAYHIDTVVTSHKEGTWNKLWQDEQKGLFVVSGRVSAGLDLNKLTQEQVQVSEDGKNIRIQLPAVQVLSSSLDKTEMYDVKTGLLGFVDIDPALLTEAQTAAREKIVATACQSGILKTANDNAQKQIETLFSLTQAQVTVTTSPVPNCG